MNENLLIKGRSTPELPAASYFAASLTSSARDREFWMNIITFLPFHVTFTSLSPLKAALSNRDERSGGNNMRQVASIFLEQGDLWDA